MNTFDDLEPEKKIPDEHNLINDLDILDSEDWLFQDLEAKEESESDTLSNNSILPFDPKSIKITVEAATIYNLAQRLKQKKIDLYPNFQRKANLWDDVRKSRLIESVLLRFPLPAFYFDVQDEDHWLVIDGLQRLSTINHFIVDNQTPLKLIGLEIFKELEQKQFRELDILLRRRILETNVTTFQIQAGTPKEVKYNIFRRINTGGLGLTPMEIRHALNQKGPATDFFKELTGEKKNFFTDFLADNKVPTSRMEDRELVLRYVAFSLVSYKEYQVGLSKFLDDAMEKLDKLDLNERNVLIVNLKRSIECYRKIFGNTRFGRGLTLRAKMNSAIFEVWTTELARLTDKQHYQLIEHRELIKDEYQDLIYNKDSLFHKSIVSGTAAKGAVENRFRIIHDMLQKYITND